MVVTFPPPGVAWNVSPVMLLFGAMTTLPVGAAIFSVTVKAVDWANVIPEVGPERVAVAGTAVAL